MYMYMHCVFVWRRFGAFFRDNSMIWHVCFAYTQIYMGNLVLLLVVVVAFCCCGSDFDLFFVWFCFLSSLCIGCLVLGGGGVQEGLVCFFCFCFVFFCFVFCLLVCFSFLVLVVFSRAEHHEVLKEYKKGIADFTAMKVGTSFYGADIGA